MKNWEKYEKEIRDIGVDNLAIIGDKPVSCSDQHGARCLECQLDVTNCEDQIYDWLYQDYNDIKVGDVLQHSITGRKMYVTNILNHNHFEGFGISSDNSGEIYDVYSKEKWNKTGKHIPLDKVIELIGGDK